VDHPSAWLAGYIPDLPTPFDQNNKIDLASFERLCERQIDAGTTALVVGETTGESSTLTPAEHDLIVRAAVKTSRGRVRIIAGGHSSRVPVLWSVIILLSLGCPSSNGQGGRQAQSQRLQPTRPRL
jgi:hypothetical protein